MAALSFVILVPYEYKSDANEDLTDFLDLFICLPKDPKISVQIILQPNRKLIRNDVFILSVKNAALPEWTAVGRFTRLNPTRDYKYRYKVTEVLLDEIDKKVHKQSLEKDNVWRWKQKPRKDMYRFEEPTDLEFELWRKNESGNRDYKAARCLKLNPDINYRSRWRVLEVFGAGIGKTIAGVKLPSQIDPKSNSVLLQWVTKTGPRKWIFINPAATSFSQDNAQIWEEEKKKWERPDVTVPVTVLPLLNWENDPKNEIKIQYGIFRNRLLHDPATIEILNKCAAVDNTEVYVHICDPDTRSLQVCTHSDLDAEVEIDGHEDTNIYEAYARYITQHYTDNKVYPALISTFFKFSSDQLGMNRLFALNKKLNEIVHNRLPGSGYFPECNTVLHYNSDYWNELKFDKNENEIMPIVQALVDRKLDVLVRNGALETEIPVRMNDYKRMSKCILYDLVQNSSHIDARDGKHFFKWLQQCPQVMLTQVHWAHHVSAAISRFIEKWDNSLNKWLCCLWKYYNPIELYKLKKLPINNYHKFKEFCEIYRQTITEEDIQSEIRNTMIQLDKIKLNRDTAVTWDDCKTAAQDCGVACVNHILHWMKVDEEEEPVLDSKLKEMNNNN